MQHGTETLLTYDTTITFTNKPTNLIFYSNSEKTEAIIIENERYLNLNGFFSLEDNKKRDIPIYWEWKLESGNTQEEIDANDLIDTSFIGKTMSMQIATTGKQVTENSTGKYAVTFDTNGGVLPSYGNTSQATKQVIYGDTYGDLPTPTREGYRFLGWNGKNMFKYDSNVNSASTSKLILNGEKIYQRKREYRPNVSIWPIFFTSTEYIKLIENKEYTVSFEIWSDYEVRFNNYMLFINNSVSPYPIHNLNSVKTSKQRLCASFVYRDGTNPILHIYPLCTSEDGVYTDNNYYISNVQVEEGSTATDYEPYYIISSTQVVQNQNHTLTAIWEEE